MPSKSWLGNSIVTVQQAPGLNWCINLLLHKTARLPWRKPCVLHLFILTVEISHIHFFTAILLFSFSTKASYKHHWSSHPIKLQLERSVSHRQMPSKANYISKFGNLLLIGKIHFKQPKDPVPNNVYKHITVFIHKNNCSVYNNVKKQHSLFHHTESCLQWIIIVILQRNSIWVMGVLFFFSNSKIAIWFC